MLKLFSAIDIFLLVHKSKLLYILPEYDFLTPSHAFHIFELLSRLGKKIDIFLLIEKGKSKPNIRNIRRIYSQRTTVAPFSVIERVVIIILARLRGYKTAYIHYSYAGAIIASMVFRLTRGRVFYWHCEYYQHLFSKLTLTWKSISKKIFDEWLMVLTMKMVTYLVTGTGTMADFYHRILGVPKGKIKIVPNWINVSRFKVKVNKEKTKNELGLTKHNKIILFVHHLSPRKGADFIPAIAETVVSRVPGAIFLVIGGGPSYKSLLKHIKKQGQEGYVRILGAVPNVEIPKYFALSDVFIMPSRQEGFGRVLLEAMVMGVPFVATGGGGVKDILSSYQKRNLLPVGDLELFADRVVELMKKKDERDKLIQEGKIQVKKFSLNKVSNKFYQMLTKT